MIEFKGVTITKKANVYFDGKVTSRSILFPGGARKTLGIMLPGEYKFNTDDREIMDILSGDLEVLLPGSEEWITIHMGENFEVPASSSFTVKVKTVTDYCCTFVD